MKIHFDDEAWQRLQDDINAGQVCGEMAAKLFVLAKGAMQQASSAIVGTRDASPGESAHAAELLKSLRNAARDAARQFAAAVALIDELARPVKEAAARRRGTHAATNSDRGR